MRGTDREDVDVGENAAVRMINELIRKKVAFEAFDTALPNGKKTLTNGFCQTTEMIDGKQSRLRGGSELRMH